MIIIYINFYQDKRCKRSIIKLNNKIMRETYINIVTIILFKITKCSTNYELYVFYRLPIRFQSKLIKCHA